MGGVTADCGGSSATDDWIKRLDFITSERARIAPVPLIGGVFTVSEIDECKQSLKMRIDSEA